MTLSAGTGSSINLDGANMQRLSLSEQALKVLRQAMVSGQLRAGEIYSAAALAQRLGVSNSPVREAMLMLVNEGLMVPVRNRGFQVVAVTPEEVQEIYELRLMLEVPAMVRLAERSGEFDLEKYRVTAQAIVDSAKAGSITGYLEADREFHLSLTELLGNSRLTKLVGNLRDQTRLYGLEVLKEEGNLVASAEEHFHILDALKAGDAAETERLMNRHLGHVVNEWSGPASK